jgi:cytosine deaminase
MAQQFDILIRHAQMRGKKDQLFDIGIEKGKIVAVEKRLTTASNHEIDANGNLVTESYVNSQVHLDKAYTLEMVGFDLPEQYHKAGVGNVMTIIEKASRVKEYYTEEWIQQNARKAVAHAALYGNTHLRGFVDVDPKAGIKAVEALIRVREEFKGIVDIQVVAFAQDGILREPGTEALLRKALEIGADVIGGNPWLEYSQRDVDEHIGIVFDIAEKYNCNISMPVDVADDPGARSLETTSVETIRRGWQGRVIAHQARAMALYPKSYLEKVIALMKKANIALDSSPHVAPLFPDIKMLDQAGIVICMGQDDISDAYYPFGRNNMLEVAFLAAHFQRMTSESSMQTLYNFITCNAAQAIGIKDFGLMVGNQAHLVVLNQPSILEALRYHEEPLHTISHGNLVDKDAMRALAFGS